MKKLLLLFLVLCAGISQASATASWLGKSAIYVNGTWYYCSEDLGDLTDDPFHNHNFGAITYLTLGGQSEVWESGDVNWQGGSVTMYYKIDNDDSQNVSLPWFEYNNGTHNNIFRSNGSTFSPLTIDISGLSAGSHTIQVWFNCDEKWDNNNNNSNNYQATFTIPAQTISSGTYGIATYSSPFNLDFSAVTDIDAFVITGDNGDGTLTTVEVSKNGETAGKKVPANTGLLIRAAANTNVTIPIAATTDVISTNWLKPGTGEVISQSGDGGSTNYILTVNKADDTTADTPKFFKVNDEGNTVPTGKAYLQIPASTPAPAFFNFDFDNTPAGISVTLNDNEETIKTFFNLAGQRVAQPTKGLYIVNGKKVVVK